MDIKPVAYYCDHRTPGAVPHQSIELPEGEGYQIQERPETLSALTFADQRHYPEHLRDFHCPAAVPLYLPADHRDHVLTEAADIASEEGMRLELEFGIEPARGARCAAARIRRAARTTTVQGA